MGPMTIMAIMAAMSAGTSANAKASNVTQALQESIRYNKSAAESNLAAGVRTAYRSGLMRVGLAQQQRQIAFKTSTARIAALSAASESEANSAGAGVVGASVNAVQADITKQLSDFEAQQEQELQNANFNYNTQLENLSNEARSNIKYPANVRVPSNWTILGQSLVQGAMTAGTMYLGSQLQLGLGTPGGGVQTQMPAPISGP